MLRRSRVFKFIAYSCVIAPVAFYAGIRLRGIRSPSSEASLEASSLAEGGAVPIPATLQPQEGVEWLREEEKLLEGKRREIERKIAELQARNKTITRK